MSLKRFGQSDEISDAMRARTLALPYQFGTGIGDDHDLVTLDATTASIFDIGTDQVFKIDAAASTGDLVYASGASPGYAFLNIGASGTYLRSDGASPGWSGIVLSDVPTHDLLSGTHGDTVTGSPAVGDLVYGNTSASWAKLAIGASGTYLRSDGASPGWITIPVGDVPVHDLLSGTHGDTAAQAVARGSLVHGDATPAWNELAIGAQYTHLESDGTDVAWQANVTLADDAWIGIASNDLRMEFDLTDGDIMLGLGDTAGSDQVQILDSDNGVVAYVDSNGNADFEAHGAFGGDASVGTGDVLRVSETATATSGTYRGVYVTQGFDPTGSFSTDVRGFQAEVVIGAAQTRTGGTIEGFRAKVIVSGGVDARSMVCYGASFTMDIEDAGSGGGTGAATAYALNATTSAVDTGVITAGGGLRITQGGVGAGSITNLRGLSIASINAGTNNWALETSAGNVVFNQGGDAATDFRVESNTYTHMLFVDAGFESVLINSSADLSSTFGVVATANTDIVAVFRGAASQSEHMVVYQDSAGNAFFESGDGIAGSVTTWNQQGVDADFYIEASGVADAFFLRGSDGQITLGVLGAGAVQSTAGGVLSAGALPLTDLASYAQGAIIRGGAADWEAYAHPGGAGYALTTDATDVVWDQTPAWTGQHTFGAGWLLSGGVADLDGVADALVLDADGNTTISAPTNDQIDIEINGADDFTFTANAFNVLTGSDIVMADGTSIGQAAGPLLTFDDTNNYLEITGCSVGIGATAPATQLHVYHATNDVAVRIETAKANGAAAAQFHNDVQDWGCGTNAADQFQIRDITGGNNIVLIAAGASANSVHVGAAAVGINTTGPDRRLDVLDGSNPQLRLTRTDGTVYVDLQATAAGDLYINPSGATVTIGVLTPSTKMSAGLTITQAANDDSILSLQSSDVSHPFTDLEDTDTYGAIQKPDAAFGGVMLRGFREDSSGTANYGAIHTQGFLAENADTGHTAGDHGITRISSAITDAGTGYANINTDGHILTVENNNSTRFIFSEDGDMNYDGAAPANYDSEDDALALWDLSHVLAGEWGKIIRYSGEKLEQMGVITIDRSENAESGHEIFVSLKNLNILMMGAAGQMYRRIQRLERSLVELGCDLALLK